MKKCFNVTGACNPKLHYMVNIHKKLEEIKKLVDNGAYFTINRARQYGKTTTLRELKKYLSEEYIVVSIDFQLLSHASFKNEAAFVRAFSRELSTIINGNELIPDGIKEKLNIFAMNKKEDTELGELFWVLSTWCASSSHPVVLMIDEVDSASDNQVFLDFLSQLRGYYIHRDERPTFQSVILASVFDVKNLRRKIRSEDEHRMNSPWNIAADFNIDMSFSAEEIAGMLAEYENDCHTGMDIKYMSELLYDYTAGYPFLVSRLCKLMDEKTDGNAWTKMGFDEAIRMLLSEKNTLFESLTGKLANYPELNSMLESMLFTGRTIAYNPDNTEIDMAAMFGFIKNMNGTVMVANRIFEMRLYNLYLSRSKMQNKDIYMASLQDKNRFITDGYLNMRLILERFTVHFNDLYGDRDETFLEDEGRKYFLLYLRPIINGTGNYYIESRTRSLGRTDVIVDYRGEQYVIEMKLWHGEEYNKRGERQLIQYLDDYHQDKGYMISFNFNKKKKTGVHEIVIENKTLIEAVV